MINRINEKRRMVDRLHDLGYLSEEEALTLHAQEEPVLTEELHRAVLSFLISTKSKLAVLNQEDLFKEKEQTQSAGNPHRISQLVEKDALFPGGIAGPSRSSKSGGPISEI